MTDPVNCLFEVISPGVLKCVRCGRKAWGDNPEITYGVCKINFANSSGSKEAACLLKKGNDGYCYCMRRGCGFKIKATSDGKCPDTKEVRCRATIHLRTAVPQTLSWDLQELPCRYRGKEKRRVKVSCGCNKKKPKFEQSFECALFRTCIKRGCFNSEPEKSLITVCERCASRLP